MQTGQSVHAVSANLVSDVGTLEGALSRLQGLGYPCAKNFQLLEMVIETHFRNDLEILRNFADRKFRTLASLMDAKAREKLHSLSDRIRSQKILHGKDEMDTIQVLEHLARLARAFQGEEPVTN